MRTYPNAVTVDIYAQDHRNWIAVIRAETNRSFLVSVASIDNENVCGLILVSGAGRPLSDIMREQLKANPANKPILEQAFSAIESLEGGEKIDIKSLHIALQPLFRAEVQNVLISALAVDPAQAAAAANTDTLIVHGKNGIQISTIDAQKLADTTGGQLVLIEGVNHILKEAPVSRSENIATYSNPDLPVSEKVIAAIRKFIAE